MGQRKGYKQTPEHIANRRRVGEQHHNWKGDAIKERSGRSRAIRAYPVIGSCVKCGALKAERHHKNGNTADNSPENIEIVCRRCHMQEDGRLLRVTEMAKRNHQAAIEARAAMPKPTHCPKGHLYVKRNKRGCGVCQVCLNEYKRNKRRMDKQNNSLSAC